MKEAESDNPAVMRSVFEQHPVAEGAIVMVFDANPDGSPALHIYTSASGEQIEVAARVLAAMSGPQDPNRTLN